MDPRMQQGPAVPTKDNKSEGCALRAVLEEGAIHAHHPTRAEAVGQYGNLTYLTVDTPNTYRYVITDIPRTIAPPTLHQHLKDDTRVR